MEVVIVVVGSITGGRSGGCGVRSGIGFTIIIFGVRVGSGARTRGRDNAIKGFVEALVFVFFVPCFAHRFKGMGMGMGMGA